MIVQSKKMVSFLDCSLCPQIAGSADDCYRLMNPENFIEDGGRYDGLRFTCECECHDYDDWYDEESI